MKIAEVNFTDLMGKRYNGFDLHLALRERGYDAVQFVKKKTGDSESVISLAGDYVEENLLLYTEKKLAIQNLLYSYGKTIKEDSAFRAADIVHYHISYNNMISLFDMPELLREKKSVWTFHDLWPITGRCIHPMECDGWKTGCEVCRRINETPFDMSFDNAAKMWCVKKKLFSEVTPDIVVPSLYMKHFVQVSPMTEHLDKVHVIPFGIHVEAFQLDKSQLRWAKGITKADFVIGFRADDNPIKGCKYVYEMLKKLSRSRNVILAVVGGGIIPEEIAKDYRIINFGWQNSENIMAQFYNLCDVFLMPSEAESFGMMAIEAMASEVPVVCFQGTVVEELIDVPKCGISVAYRDVNALKEAVESLMNNEEGRKCRADLSRRYAEEKYCFEYYVKKHVDLYEELYARAL